MRKEFSFPKSLRLLNSSDFSPVFDKPSFKVHHPQFLLLAKFNNLNHPRLGIVVAKKNIRLAVNRNRTKRLIRETFRNKQNNLPTIDAIVLARRGNEELLNEQILEILEGIWRRAAKKAQKNNPPKERER
ncbi:ribonuclease P protein component [Agarilytica rhodophyticola]|uniref:ribonuclease P protein component n=1 Tax=Agarilytica rhodophyticola TaxID=1737490 RepID=UPI000B34546D|nr:ribonuclease P protein component [Agarilytica rhodophyticola]